MSDTGNMSFSDSENCPSLNLQMFVCSVCGDDHETENCVVVQSLKQVYDSKILSRARQTLPKNLDVKTLADGSTTVISNELIEEGTQFGPFQSPLSIGLHPGIVFPLKVFGKNLDEGYYLDTTDEELCNWMCLVAPATNIKEQNLICYDVKQSIFFTTTRDVHPGEEIRVWYALYYGLKLQALPLADDSTQEDGFCDLATAEAGRACKPNEEASAMLGEDLLQSLAQHLPAHVLGAPGERDVWICKLCGCQESNVASYARHLMTHYGQQVNENDHPKCKVCMKRFLSKKMLHKHMSKSHKSDLDGDKASHPKLLSGETQMTLESLEDKELSSDQKDNFDPKPEHENDSIDGSSNSLHHSNHSNSEDEEGNEHNLYCSVKLKRKGPNKNLGKKLPEASGFCGSEPQSPSLCKFEEGNEKTMNVSKALPNRPESHPGLTIPIEVMEERKQNTIHISELSKNKGSEFGLELNVKGSCEQLVIQSNNGESFSTTVNLNGAKDLDEALATGEPIYIVVESSAENKSLLSHSIENISDETITSKISLAAPQQCTSIESSEKESLAYNCDICLKSFGKCSYLYRHLRKHTGEFTCVTCLAVFARKENLKTHSCSQPKEWFPCPTCGKKFSAKKYLQRHAPTHTGEFSCSDCKKNFASRLSLKCHRCGGNSLGSEKAMKSCFMCERTFDSELKLQAHLKVHSDVSLDKRPSKKANCKPHTSAKHVKRKADNNLELSQSESSDKKKFICEVCGAIFKSYASMKNHRFLHGERKFKCDVCNKRFHRKDVLQEHLRVHQDANFPCSICGKKYKTKKSLHVHSLIHKGSKRFACGECGKEFFQKGNLLKHVHTHTSNRLYTCEHCEKSFSSKEYFNIHVLTHTQGKIYQCQDCKRSFVKRHLLDAHRQLYHSNRGFLCKFCNTIIRHRHSVRRHLEKTHSDHQQEWSTPGFIDTLLSELPEKLMNLSGDLKLSPKQQEERQQLLESLRKTLFDRRVLTKTPVDSVSSKVVTMSNSSTLEDQESQLLQVDPVVTVQSTQQLTLIDNFSPHCVRTESTLPGEEQSVMVSENVQASGGEIFLALMDQETVDSSLTIATPILTSDALNSDILSTGGSFMMEDSSGNNSVLLYVVETSNVEGETEDLVWCNDSVEEQL